MTGFFADDRVIPTDSEYTLQRVAHELHFIVKEYNLITSTQKTKAMAFIKLETVGSKTILIIINVLIILNTFIYK